MIETVKIQGDGYLVNGTMSVPKADGNRQYEAVKVWLQTNTAEPEFTQTELDEQLVLSIESAATQWIESVYSPLKQRKLMSVAIALQDKQIQGIILSTDEEAMLQYTRDVNTWITSVRIVENSATAALTPLDQIVFPVKP